MIRQSDVVIMGGGLAGLTLALQLRQTLPSTGVIIVDQHFYPVPETTFKVGESMVEVSSWYLREVLGLGTYLLQSHLPKFGLRFFMSDGENSDLGQRPEYGLMTLPERPTNLNMGFPGVHLTTYNVDRGRLENHLLKRCLEVGVEVFQGCKVKSVNLDDPHEIAINGDTSVSKLKAHWLIDTTGRAGFLARQLDLRRSQGHHVNAVWFRLKGRVDPDRMTNDVNFHCRTFPDLRWLSTNHFMGAGYWVWLIPLPDEATSVGIMTDPSVHPFEQINSFEGAITWLKEREPSLAAAITSLPQLDFKILKAQSYISRHTFSSDRWALCGESAFYTDALYSPGGDFIAVGNTIITKMVEADYISDRTRLSILVKFGEQLLNGLFDHYMEIYRGSYQLMGKPGVMMQKVAWDTAVYFAYNVLLFRNGSFCEPNFHRVIGKENARLKSLQHQMTSHFKTYDDCGMSYSGKFVDQARLAPVHSLYLSSEKPLEAEALKVRLNINLEILEYFANNIVKLVS